MIVKTIEAKLVKTNTDGSIIMICGKIELKLNKHLTTVQIDKEIFQCTYATTKTGYIFFVDLGDSVCIDTNEKTAKSLCFIFGLKVTKEVKQGRERSFSINKSVLKNKSGATFGWTCLDGYHRKAYAITYEMIDILKGQKID